MKETAAGSRICRWEVIIKTKNKIKWCIVAAAILAAQSHPARATGFAGPWEYLGETGGGDADATPEFNWEMEVERMAGEFHPTEKFRPFRGDAADNYSNHDEADKKDRAAAQKEGEIKAQKQNDAGDSDDSSDSDSGPPPDGEFGYYEQGADAYRSAQDGDETRYAEARKQWETLLNLPAKQRRYRTVWATFMLGKTAIDTHDYAKAVDYFEQTRKLAKAGFADSLYLAADSYGWEALAEALAGHPEKAAPLYLTQLALGDKTAVASLKTLIPDRDMQQDTQYGPWEMEKWSDEKKKEYEAKTHAALKSAAADPLLRRLVTAHILATETVSWIRGDNKVSQRAARWLAIVDEANLGKVQDAEYLGWLAYSNGDYKAAAHWLALADPGTPASCWLQAKLELRDGKIDAAAASMEKAWKLIGDGDRYAGIDSPWKKTKEYENDDYAENGVFTFAQSAAGDLGLVRLSRADFAQALDTFRKGGLWQDAAYVAERVLTVDELKAYVDRQPAADISLEGKLRSVYEDDYREDLLQREGIKSLRYLLARRLVREDRYAEAVAYFPKPYGQVLAKYVQALKDGANEKLPAEQRAKAWYTAAWLAGNDGMELMGTEVAPDGFFFDGDLREGISDIASMRKRQAYPASHVDFEQDTSNAKFVPFDIKVSNEEQARLAKSDVVPNRRYHYRAIAAALAMRAAALLSDNTEELADVLNTAGGWVKTGGDDLRAKYYNVLQTRCPATAIGRKVLANSGFVDDPGPWSKEQAAAHDAMLKALGLKPGIDASLRQ